MKIKKIAVIGAGEMGHGITEVLALHNYDVNLMDSFTEALQKGLKGIQDSLTKFVEKGKIKKEEYAQVLNRIKTFSTLSDAVKDVDLVIEAVPEIPELKFKIFKDLDQYAPTHAILTSNTSNIRISDIANSVTRRDKVAGLHFFNPPVIMKLVEVIKGDYTSEETINELMELTKTLEKTPVKVLKDRPGFIVNRINAPDTLFFCLLLDKKIVDAEEVDAFARSQGLPMGPYELMDFVGIDVVYHSLEYYKDKLSPDYGKCKTYKEMFESKQLGKKTGKGFYDWSKGRPLIDTSKATQKVSLMDLFAIEINEAVKIIEEGVASPSDIDTAVMLGLNRPFGPISVAKSLTNAEVKSKLEQLAKNLDCTVFEPAESIKQGKLKEAIMGRIVAAPKAAEVVKEEKKEAVAYKTINLEKFDFKVARIILNRPKHNPINIELIEELDSVIEKLWNDMDVNVIIITGQGTTLSSGADLSTYFANPVQFLEFFRKGERTLRKLAEIPKLTIAVMKGYALGGGLELAMACDLRIATEDVVLGLPEVTRGLIPGWGGTQRAVKLIGMSNALRLVLTGERITGKEEDSMGLVTKLVKENIDEYALEYAKSVASSVAPISVMLAKRLVNKAAEVPMDVGLEMEAFGGGIVFSTEDLREGISAFMQKRKPEYKGK